MSAMRRIAIKAVEAELEHEVLRMLWTFHFASTAQLTRLIWSGYTESNRKRLRRTLERLLTVHLIWREPLRLLAGFRGHSFGKVSGGWFYGLTEQGRQVVLEHLPHLAGIHCLTRDAYLSLGDRRTLRHAFHYTEYCTGLIEELRRHPLTAGLFFDTECTRLGSHLRMDGLFRMRLWRKPPPHAIHRDDAPPWYVPWLSSLREPLVSGLFDATFAIEIDEGSEELRVLVRKAENYRRTYAGGMVARSGESESGHLLVDWPSILCPAGTESAPELRTFFFPIPVVIVPGPQRLINVFEAWQRGWATSEVRVTSWFHIHERGSIVKAPYLNQNRQWVDLLGRPLAYSGRLPQATA
jgi:hypothetical protein